MLDEVEIQCRLKRTSPVPNCTLPFNEQVCPICFEPYIPKNEVSAHVDLSSKGASEISVRVRSCWPGSTCRHAFGHNCIEAHIRSAGPWSNKCPTCREEWFPEDETPPFTSTDGRIDNGGDNHGSHFTSNLSSRDNARDKAPLSLENKPKLSDSSCKESEAPKIDLGCGGCVGGVGRNLMRTPMANMEGLSNRGKVARSVQFLERILLTSNIDDDHPSISFRVQDVELAIEALWHALECRG
ncbi:hypothetical protein BU24DRAFT_469146 [Aaosphaeria arxii CBS 175.79]|uniref:RING-type domain-containing protein n=1 Tax=Aaosphaeria arxii CBS 175.79 TaxID=1450172 RepID=A0A6A5Y511_9PLEO|nr:uncharacterized protein BU24DRAFT_469146 [Aaosphaeria arxii CBS 175.79]KAF2020359.1 hypothetical protein BU24DRAFT_469146 [Aaosphaeria arxii CBS 175.79]